MKKGVGKKSIVFGIILLFVGAGIIPNITANIKQKNNKIEEIRNQSVPTSTTDWWPMFHHDLGHTGYSSSEAPNLRLRLWNYGTDWGVSASPTVVDDKVYIGSQDRNLYCLNAVNGERIWKYNIYDEYQFSPSSAAVVNNRVYFGAINGYICCLNASDGSEIWIHPTGGVAPSVIQSSPIIVDGRVYIGGGASNKGVFCLDAETGDEIWNFTADHRVLNSPAVVNGKVYIGNDRLYCLNALNGSLLRNTTEKYFASSPTVAADRLYIGSFDYNVYCLNAETFDEIWNYSTGDSVESTPAVAYGNVYVGSDDDKIYCFDAENGDLNWTYETDGDVYSSPAVADDKVFVGSADNYVYCLNAYTGAAIWKDKTGGAVTSSPAIADGKMYVGSGDGKIYAYRDGEFKIEFVKPQKGCFYFRDFRLFCINLILRSFIMGPMTITVNAIDTKYGIKNVTFYYDGVAMYTDSVPDGDNNYEWYWPAWIHLRPIFIGGVLNAVTYNQLNQSLEVDESIQFIRIGGYGWH